mmetsp:Transcript_11288/g.16689  ORF Transcript_11288/g.16689 Transcript_11288/m.16689 type:complete len:281 (+) Transcript_11288:77-919(+)
MLIDLKDKKPFGKVSRDKENKYARRDRAHKNKHDKDNKHNKDSKHKRRSKEGKENRMEKKSILAKKLRNRFSIDKKERKIAILEKRLKNFEEKASKIRSKIDYLQNEKEVHNKKEEKQSKKEEKQSKKEEEEEETKEDSDIEKEEEEPIWKRKRAERTSRLLKFAELILIDESDLEESIEELSALASKTQETYSCSYGTAVLTEDVEKNIEDKVSFIAYQPEYESDVEGILDMLNNLSEDYHVLVITNQKAIRKAIRPFSNAKSIGTKAWKAALNSFDES